MTEDRSHPIYRRSAELVAAITGYLYDTDEPTPWHELVAMMTTPARGWKAVESTLYTLVSFGAVHKIGTPAARGRRDSRALVLSPLGRAWLDRELLPLVERPEQ